MATSRRRERELARRRFERRRQAELERRAKAKKRNSRIGAVGGSVAVIVVLVIVLVAALSGGTKKKPAAVKPASSTSPSPTASATPAPPAPTKCAKISPNPPAKGQPTVPPVKGKVPTTLVKKDITVGHGPAAKSGASLSVTYIGISCDTGQVFDATYKDGGKPFAVTPLGTAGVIQGWNQGLVGMKAGGVRELIIPASLGYGPGGSPPAIQGNDTLIFLVTAKSVKNK